MCQGQFAVKVKFPYRCSGTAVVSWWPEFELFYLADSDVLT